MRRTVLLWPVVTAMACSFHAASDQPTKPDAPSGTTDAAHVFDAAPGAVPASCKDILAANANASSGVYTIDPDGSGGGSAFEVDCDMTTSPGGFMLVGRERVGSAAAGAGPLRFLGIDSMNPNELAEGTASGIIGDRFVGAYQLVVVTSGSDFFRFDAPVTFEMFGNGVDTAIPITGFETSDATLDGWVNQAGGAHLCIAASSPDTRPGDNSWAIKPQSDQHVQCGCDDMGWTGSGAYYGGTPNGQQTSCTGWGGGWAGVKPTGVQKGGIAPAVETRIWIR